MINHTQNDIVLAIKMKRKITVRYVIPISAQNGGIPMGIPLTTERNIATLSRYLKAGNPDDVAPLTASIGRLAKMFDATDKNVRACLRDNCIQPVGIGDSGARYNILEVWDAVQATKGKEFPKRGKAREIE